MFIAFPLRGTNFCWSSVHFQVYSSVNLHKNSQSTCPTHFLTRRIQWSVAETTEWIEVLVNMIKDRVPKMGGEPRPARCSLKRRRWMASARIQTESIHLRLTSQQEPSSSSPSFLRLFLPHRRLLLPTSRRIVGDYPTAREIFIPAPIFSSISLTRPSTN